MASPLNNPDTAGLPTMKAFEKMRPEMQQALTRDYYRLLFARDTAAALQAYVGFIGTLAIPDVYVEHALANETNAQIALAAIRDHLDLAPSQGIFVALAEKYPELSARLLNTPSAPEPGVDPVMDMLHHVRSGAYKFVPSIPDNRVLGVQRSEERVSSPQPGTKAPKPR